MGPTGSGKSTFVDTATKQNGKTIGHALKSCTSSIGAFKFKVPGDARSFVLVDTPGFDDTNMSDTEILHMIADWLEQTYKRRILLTGIIYLHRISDNRMAGSPLKNLRMFAKLCGDDSMENVVLATTMWGLLKDRSVGERRQEELAQKYWQPLLACGCTPARFENTYESAWAIINKIVDATHPTHSTLLQEEMVDLRRRLCETEAGVTLYNSLQKSLADQKEAIRKLRDEAVAEQNEDLARELTAQIEVIQAGIQEIFDQVTKMKISIGRRILLFFSFKKARSRGLTIPA